MAQLDEILNKYVKAPGRRPKVFKVLHSMSKIDMGKVGLDDDLRKLVPKLSTVEVLKGFDDDGKPIMEKKTKPVTLRLSSKTWRARSVLASDSTLLTHSSGFAYDAVDPKSPAVFPSRTTRRSTSFKRLGMSSTTFRMPKRSDLAERRAPIGYRAAPGGPFGAGPTPVPDSPSMPSGGTGLYSTANDYSKALVALLAGGGGLLNPESVRELREPQLPDNKYLVAEFHGPWHDAICPAYPKGTPASYRLGGALNLEDLPQKRRKGSLMWSGMANTHWWIDWESGIAATLFVQVLPPFDSVVVAMIDELERALFTKTGGLKSRRERHESRRLAS